MESILKYLLYAIAVVALVTGANVLIGGAAAVPGSLGSVEATVDNELRFFSVYWVAYGAFCFWVARNLRSQSFFVPFIALFFLLGGVGRLISTLTIGSPAFVLVPAMVLEFVLPVAIFGLYWKYQKMNITKGASE
jgi:uncharacterized protein DUF4345